MTPAIVTHSPAEVQRNVLVNVRTGLGADAIAEALINNLHCLQAKLPQHATRNDWYMATVASITETNTAAKAIAYLSAEFLTGPHLGNSLINLGIWQNVEEALNRVGQALSLLLSRRKNRD